MVKALTVYKASAGSGKTFTLATEYIKLLVKNPMRFRNILAVTFTNKATEEMKMRILSQLYGIWQHLPESDHYLQRVVKDTGIGEEIVRQQAGTALHLLLHNYNYFRVETIDAFFQSVLRNLARELDLTANLRISLMDKEIESEAVDRLIDSLTHTDLMLQWLLSYIKEKIDDDRSWNIVGEVKSFGLKIFSDPYKEHRVELNQKIAEKGFFESYTRQLRQLCEEAKERMKEFADAFFDTLESEGLTIDDLSQKKKGVAGFFMKLREGKMDEGIVNSYTCRCREDASNWYSKKHPQGQRIHAMAETSLIQLLSHAMDERPRQYRIYQSATLTLRHLSQLRLLGSIEQKVRSMNNEANRFLLGDTQQLLHDLISDSDSPFIFEKIGTQLEHVMIDEFQDTSTVQWRNFKVLLQECMSHQDSSNLIVGDVKQSIYRFRSGDWRLLNAIDREFPHSDETVEIKPLDTNYRSNRHIIEFNNAFFTEAVLQEYAQQYEVYPSGAEQLRSAYADVEQQVPQKREKEGLVDVRLLAGQNYQEQTLCEITDIVHQLLAEGATMNSIAILVRENKYIPLIADHFASYLPEVRIVSDEAFRLDASVSVCLLVQALHLLTHPDDLLAKATIVKLYHRFVLGDKTEEQDLLIKDHPLDSLLPEAYICHTRQLLQMPLYELVERLYAIFDLQRLHEQSAYMCAFYDQLNLFIQEHSTDIDSFVREWEETLCSKTIQNDESIGIRIMSFHKSKGLEFEHVIIPFCNWKLTRTDLIWCHSHEAPFDALPILPIAFSEKQMKGTVYEADYLDEQLQRAVDQLNLLYVAFTRAAGNLFVIGHRGEGKARRSALIESVLPAINQKLEGSILAGADDDNQSLTFTYGTLSIQHADKQPTASNNVFLQHVSPLQIPIETFDVKTEFRQSNRSRDFIEGDDEQSAISYIKIGSVLHEIFSTIHTTADIHDALQRLQHEGILYDDEVTREKLSDMLHRRLENNRVRNWFSDKWKLFNECSILQLMPDGEVRERRPDRVMTDGRETHVVDFKFGKPRAEYHDQVREYMHLLRQMDMPCVKGWLWYVYSNQIEEVEG